MAAGQDDDHSNEQRLQRVAEIARRLAEAADLDDLLQRIVTLGEEHLDRCDGVSLMLIRKGGEISTPTYTSRVAYDSDQAQFLADEGPCLESIREHHSVHIRDLRTEERWPAYRERVLALGIRSMLGVRLFVLGDTMGALNFYSSEPNAFDEYSLVLAQVFASHAAVALKAAIAEAGAEAAIRSRDVIGQAKGIIMAQERCTADDAFIRLRELSQALHRPLRELADEIAATGDIPKAAARD